MEFQTLGAGDLIDRSVRLYRLNFFTLIRIAALPVLVSAIGSVLLTFGWRGFYTTGVEVSFAFYTILLISGVALWIGGSLLTLMVMGGAARNLVRHLLWGEAVTFRETFRNVRSRFWSLLAATVLAAGILLCVSFVCLYGGITVISIAVIVGALIAVAVPVIGIIIGIIMCLAATLFSFWLFFLVAGKFAYVPQVLLVEGQGVFASIGRSISLASGNWRRFGALISFSTFATYSALMILWLPLVWYAQTNGIQIFDFDGNTIPPLWYSVTTQLVWQTSLILLAPIWMLGLSLMYVDERVRHEAYDVELMAARSLGEMPPLVNPQHNPLRPALGVQAQIAAPEFATSRRQTLNLNYPQAAVNSGANVLQATAGAPTASNNANLSMENNFMSDAPPNIYEDNVPNPAVQEAMNDEIENAPQAPTNLRDRVEASRMDPELSGGDIDASWEEADDDGAEAFGGHNPTPDQSDVEANAAAMGFTFQDNQEIDLLEKMQKRDDNRFELEEDSKDGDTI